MEARELRIGNWTENWKGEIQQVTGIEQVEHNLPRIHTIDCVGICADFKPIPLTEEWLVKFGFEKKTTTTKHFSIDVIHYERNRARIYFVNSGFELEINVLGEWFNLGMAYKHVHQLQNLFYCLCSEELTLKEK